MEESGLETVTVTILTKKTNSIQATTNMPELDSSAQTQMIF